MYSKVKEVFIGGAVARTPVTGTGINAVASSAQVGGIYILDKNKNVMTPGQTFADTDVIYVAETLSTNHSGSTPAGSAFTYKDILISEPINGNFITKYTGKTYSAKAEQVTTFNAITTTKTVGDEYVLRIVYKDIKTHPGQKTQTFRVIGNATNTASDTAFYDAFRSQINGNQFTRITATGTTTLILTGKAIPETTTSVNDIDEFSMVTFEAFFYYIHPTTNFGGVGPFSAMIFGSATTTTGPTYPQGSWEVVRDAEKSVLGQHRGVTNRIWFPVKQPVFRTSSSLSYNSISIEFAERFKSPDTGYTKRVSKQVQIFIPTTTADYQASVLSILNPWVASTPSQLDSVVI